MNFRELTRLVMDQNQRFLKSNQPVALGMSGGIDSIALFYVFCEFVKLKKISNFIILHVNYGLRGDESDGDFRFCQDLATQYEVPFFSLDAKPLERQVGESTQLWARRIRHEWFEKYHQKGYQIALAHNANDVAETVLFRMARGAQPENLAGMSRCDRHIWRPMISILRTDIVAAMTEANFQWREDSSNLSRKYARNRIRHNVLGELEQMYPGATQRIADLGQLLSTSTSDQIQSDTDLEVALASHNLSRNKVKDVQTFLSKAAPGQSLDLGSGFTLLRKEKKDRNRPDSLALQGAARSMQHMYGIDGPCLGAVMSGNSQLFIAKPANFSSRAAATLIPIKNDSRKDLQSTEILLRTPKSDDKVTFAESTSSFKFKDLMQKWKITLSDRVGFVVISTKHTTNLKLVKLFQSGNDLDGAVNG